MLRTFVTDHQRERRSSGSRLAKDRWADRIERRSGPVEMGQAGIARGYRYVSTMTADVLKVGDAYVNMTEYIVGRRLKPID
jgi:hypothetical protein